MSFSSPNIWFNDRYKEKPKNQCWVLWSSIFLHGRIGQTSRMFKSAVISVLYISLTVTLWFWASSESNLLRRCCLSICAGAQRISGPVRRRSRYNCTAAAPRARTASTALTRKIPPVQVQYIRFLFQYVTVDTTVLGTITNKGERKIYGIFFRGIPDNLLYDNRYILDVRVTGWSYIVSLRSVNVHIFWIEL